MNTSGFNFRPLCQVVEDEIQSKTIDESEDATIDIMEKMGHKPTILDMKTNMFTKVSPEYLLKILHTVNHMELQ